MFEMEVAPKGVNWFLKELALSLDDRQRRNCLE